MRPPCFSKNTSISAIVLISQPYAFHYQDQHHVLRFRYDNAFHQPRLGYIDHKHLGHDIIAADIPDLSGVLEEIIHTYFADMDGNM
jgi:hypothetical protein